MSAVAAEFPVLINGVAAVRADAIGRFNSEIAGLNHIVLFALAPLENLAYAHSRERMVKSSDDRQLQSLVPYAGILDLNKSEEEILVGASQGFRRKLRKAKNYELEITADASDQAIKDFCELLQQLLKQTGRRGG